METKKKIEDMSDLELLYDTIKWLHKRIYGKKWRLQNKDYTLKKNKEYYFSNKSVIIDKQKTYYLKNKENKKCYDKKYNRKNRERITIRQRKNQKLWREKNKNKLKYRMEQRMKSDIQFKLQKLLRGRFTKAVRFNYKNGSAVKDLGCSVDELKLYLESKFQPGMSWVNHGLRGWHIDHITPLSWFDLSDRNQLLVACHYTNLQPLWAKDNLSKNAY